MTDKNVSKVYNQLDKYIEVIKKYGNNIKAEPDHGSGFDSPELRKEFIDYAEEFHTKLQKELQSLKDILDNIQ